MAADIARKQVGREQERSGIINPSRPDHGGGHQFRNYKPRMLAPAVLFATLTLSTQAWGSGAILGVHTNIEVGWNMAGDGHAWISLRPSPSDSPTTYGLYIFLGVVNNDPPTGLWNRFYKLNESQLGALTAFLHEDHTWTCFNTCASFASDAVMIATGEDLDADDVLGIETPRELSESIRDMEKTDPSDDIDPSAGYDPTSTYVSNSGHARCLNCGDNVCDTLEDSYICAADCSPPVPCGPGPHWVDTCAAGTDVILRSVGVVGIDLTNDGQVDTTIAFKGPVTIVRSGPLDDSARYPGLRNTPGHLDVIDTEITSLVMTATGGEIFRAGTSAPGLVGPVAPTYGAIAELQNDNKLAESFFNVFFEIELTPGNYIYNQVPVKHVFIIDRVPPGPAIYAMVTPGPIPLWTSPTPMQGVQVAQLITGEHLVNIPALSEWGVVVMALLVLTAATVVINCRRAVTA